MAPLQLRFFADGVERALSLENAAVTVGRDDDQRLRLVHPSVSRRHGRFEPDADGWRYVDLDSRNGSRLNGARLVAGELTSIRPAIPCCSAPFPCACWNHQGLLEPTNRPSPRPRSGHSPSD